MSRPLCNHYAAVLSAAAAAGRTGGYIAGAVHCLILRTIPYPPETYLLNQLLTAYGKAGQVARARRLFDAIPNPNLYTYNALLTTLAHARQFSEMERLFASMPDRDVVSYNALITGFSGGGSPERAAGAYRRLLQEENVRPSRITMSSLVMVASSLGDRALGRQVHCQILHLGFGAYAFVRSPLVDMYAKVGLIRDSKHVFDELEFKNVVMYNTMITGLLRCKMVHEARDLFELMMERDPITWTTMVTGLTQNGLESEALDVFRRMRAGGVTIDQYTFGSILTACGALSAFEQGKQIHAYIIRTSEEAVRVFSDMQRDGIKPDDFTLGSVISSCANLASLEEGAQFHCLALVLFDEMSSHDQVSWTALVSGYAQFGKAKETIDLFEKMLAKGVKPDGVTFIGVLSACSRAGSGRLKEAEEFIKKMPVPPDAIGWGTLLSASKGQWSEVAQLRRGMRDRQVKKEPGCSWIKYKNKVHIFSADDQSHPFSKGIYEKLEWLNTKMVEQGYKPDVSSVLHDVAESDKEMPIRIVKNLRMNFFNVITFRDPDLKRFKVSWQSSCMHAVKYSANARLVAHQGTCSFQVC
ncbi:hypothetical protein PR202_ga06201 [Eleusine coracana subsp. coracana]|uniref:Pentatricopeptide repeat-containing protein n=1 Tax=Eleusine coracana subsp. coracana TaxID=191504 RepID=A0AAV5BU82_ELECO|nr:hypothetical protein PR202_ga06201 [Eleusine coracana subsp. coracana]